MNRPPVIGVGLFSFDFGGSERVGADLALAFKARGYEVVCFAFHSSDGPVRRELEAAEVRCLDVNYARVRGSPRRLIYWARLWRMLRRERIDALHVHHHGALILIGPPARLAGVPRVVMTEHGLQALMERAEARRLTQRYARFATDITAVEPGQVKYFNDILGIPAGKLHCVPNGIRVRLPNRADHEGARLKVGMGPDDFVFLYVGRLNAVKDLGTLLRAFALLPGGHPRSKRLVVVGDGPERRSLEALRTQLGLDAQVRFLGARGDVMQLLPAADAFVMSSVSEGLPMALLEAMAAGVPCVATAVGGIPGLLEPDAGITVPAQNPEALAQAMADLSREPDRRAQLAARATEVIRSRYAFEPVVEQYLALLGLPGRASAAR
ncbi:MAG: glycosyltransferase [Proteobacteria bacterium]|nr:glycosyltransferase [Pseudomonadota bacterium]